MTWILILLCIQAAQAADSTSAANAANSAANLANSNEQFERDVDEVALASQEKAISRVNSLLKKYQGTTQEAILLSKLAELEQQTGAILFRTAHGESHARGKALDLSKYQRAMKQSVKTLTTLIGKYPSFEEIPQAYFMRGKALEEVNANAMAAQDYIFLVTHFPESESVAAAYMSLAEFAIEANDHPKAISYLKHVEEKPDDPHYPFALYKLAWSNYNLKQIDQALSFAERQVAFYDARQKNATPEAENVVTSDSALRENTLMDITTFYLDGYESGADRYKLDGTLPYFQKLEKGPLLGRMLHRYAKLLRSHGHEADLVRWKDIVIQGERERPEVLDVILTVYENQLNRRRYPELVETAQDLVKLYSLEKKLPDFPKAQKMLLDTAEGLQALIIKNKGAKEVGDLSHILAQVYDAFTQVVEETDPRIPRVHYNLAETLFTIKDYDGATRHYRWVVDHGSWKDSPKKALNSLDPDAPLATVPDASVKAIASRYEVLRAKGLIPDQLAARSEKDSTDKSLEPALAEWVQWIDTHVEHTYEDMDNFYFEGNRVLYVQGHVAQATERLKKFAFKHSHSTYAIPSASLVIDTYIAGKDWNKSYDLANDLMDVKEWKGSEFGKRLFSVAADAFYKQLEVKYNAHDYPATISSADDFLKKYATSSRLPDTLSLAGNSAMNIGEREKALGYFSRLISEAPKSGSIGNALLARAQLEEDRYEFAGASADYRAFLSLPPSLALPTGQTKGDPAQLEALRKKTLVLAWLSGDPEKLKLTLESKAVCGDAPNTEDCSKYRLVAQVLAVAQAEPGKLSEKETAEAFDQARKATGDFRTLYSALALEGSSNLAFRDRLHAVRWVSTGWSALEPLVRFSLLPGLTDSIPKTFAANRAAMKDVAPLRADEKYITRRVEVIREMENAGTDVMKLPWARIRAEVLSELASLYLDLSHGLSTLAPPKGLSTEDLAQYDAVIHRLIMPFEEKGQDMRGKAFEIASRAAVEEDTFHKIADPFFIENPSQAKQLKPVSEIAPPAQLDLTLLSKLDPSGGWKISAKVAPSRLEDPVARFKAAWMVAVQARAWPQIAFLMNEAQEKALVRAGMMGVVRAVSLSAAGARGEALAELEEAKKDLNPIARNIVVTTLLQYSLRACSREHTAMLLKDIQTESLSGDQAALVTNAATYATKKQ